MMTVSVLTVGKLKENYLREACAEYAKRLGAYCKLSIVEVSEERAGENPSAAQLEQILRKEGERLLARLPKEALVVPLCIEGEQMPSAAFAKTLETAALGGKSHICFIIGGSFGLSGQIKKAGHLCLSVSKMTFPHQLTRLMLLEQIYRGFQINNNGKYHK